MCDKRKPFFENETKEKIQYFDTKYIGKELRLKICKIRKRKRRKQKNRKVNCYHHSPMNKLQRKTEEMKRIHEIGKRNLFVIITNKMKSKSK